MKLKRKNLIKISAVGLLSVLTFSGCSGIYDMTDAQTKVIAEYAADVLIHYDASYYDMFAEEPKIKDNTVTVENTSETESPQPTSTIKPAAIEPTEDPALAQSENLPSEPTDEAIEQVNNNTETQQPKVVPLDVGKIFGLDNVEIAYKSISIVDKYPESDDQPVFQMKPTEGHKLLVITFELLNISDTTANCNIIGQNVKFRVCINDSDYLSVQKTLLTDDLSQLNITLQPGESRNAVVVCQVPNDYNPEISSLSLVVRTAGEDNVVKIK